MGDGPDEELLRTAATDMALNEHIQFYPFTSEPEYIFEVLDVLVLSSLYKEGLPNVLLESMSMSVPVVSSRLAGVPEVVKNGDTGFMVEPGDVTGLSGAIHSIWKDKERYQAMAQNARKLMEDHFDKRKQFAAFIEKFEDMKRNI